MASSSKIERREPVATGIYTGSFIGQIFKELMNCSAVGNRHRHPQPIK
ncbi:hypothetical protein [Microcoleus sp. FACHB-672]|nr:hypothetical protein [Microcoleus sp. FACHB-672]MBD2042098.1 hypothetical protein [Microcoleus sp. FACHB-672]